MTIDTAKTYTATVKTDAGTFVITLDDKHAPITVNNFVFLAEKKFFNCVTFHRVIPTSWTRPATPPGPARGGPGTSSPTSSRPRPPRSTRSDRWPWPTRAPNTNGSQFFVVTGAEGQPWRPTTRSSGQVTSGIDVATKINNDGNANPAANGVAPQGDPPHPVRHHLVLISRGPAAPPDASASVPRYRSHTTLTGGPTMSVELPAADGSSPQRRSFKGEPPMVIDPAKRYTATMVTSKGSMTIALDPQAAPRTVNSFVFLARYHYFDGIVFHRVIPGFVLQGGDPTGTGTGGPGYKFADELPAPGRYELGSLAMANAGPEHQREPVLRHLGPRRHAPAPQLLAVRQGRGRASTRWPPSTPWDRARARPRRRSPSNR